MSIEQTYPVGFAVDYPDRSLDRVSTFLRIFFAIPIIIVLASLSAGGWSSTTGAGIRHVGFASSILFIPPLLMIVFRQKYPRWWFDWNLALLRFNNRIGVYLALMDDRYPSTDEEQSVHLSMVYPNVTGDLNRWLPLVKWLLAIPHYLVLIFLNLAAFVVVVVAWFAILFTGTYPRGLFNFVEGTLRWNLRVIAYAFILVTDLYPPFRLNP